MTLDDLRSDLAAALRAEFDDAFARPREVVRDAETIDLLAIRLGTQLYFVALEDVAGVHAGCVVSPLPCLVPELAGIVGLRGEVLATYDLCALLGVTAERTPRRWVLVAAHERVAFAFDHFEGHRRIPRADVQQSAGSRTSSSVRALVLSAGQPCPLLDVSHLLERVTDRVRASRSRKEP